MGKMTKDNKQIRENKTKSSSEFMSAHTSHYSTHPVAVALNHITHSCSYSYSDCQCVWVRLFLFSFCHLPYCVCVLLPNNWWLLSTTVHNSCACYADNKTQPTERKCQKPKRTGERIEKRRKTGTHTHTLFKKINKQFLLYYNCDCMPWNTITIDCHPFPFNIHRIYVYWYLYTKHIK